MCGPPPSDQEKSEILLAKFEDAMSTYRTDDCSAGLTKLKLTFDTLGDQMRLREYSWNCRGMILTGTYAGHTVQSAQHDIEVHIWTEFAWADLEMGDLQNVQEARNYAFMIIGEGHKNDCYWNVIPMGHKAAVVFYLDARIWERFDHLGIHDIHQRSHYLEDVVRTLREGLRHEPGNALLAGELRRRLDELEKVKETEDLMEIWDRINEQEWDEAW